MAGNPTGYGYSSGYGSDPAMDRNSYSSGYGSYPAIASDSEGYGYNSSYVPHPAMAGNPAGYGYISGYGSSPAMAMNSAGYYGSSGSNSCPAMATNSAGSSPTSAGSSPATSILLCLHTGCEYQTKRQYDLERHQKSHSSPVGKYDCTARGCGRTGEYGFDRRDHLREHMRKVHAKDIPKQPRKSTIRPAQKMDVTGEANILPSERTI